MDTGRRHLDSKRIHLGVDRFHGGVRPGDLVRDADTKCIQATTKWDQGSVGTGVTPFQRRFVRTQERAPRVNKSIS